MTFEDSQKMLIISQSNSIQDESNSLFGEIRQTLAEIRTEIGDLCADFEEDCALARIPFRLEFPRRTVFAAVEKPDLNDYLGFSR